MMIDLSFAAGFAFAVAQSVFAAANQYWVGGTSAEWGGNNWASSAGGTGEAWTSGNRAYFTTSPSTIDLNGANFTIQDIFTSGFSSGKRCAINFTNSSSTTPTLTITDPNISDANAEIGFADISFQNLKVYNSNTSYSLELNNNVCMRFGAGAVYTESKTTNARLGYSISSASNTLEVVDGAQVTLGKVYVAVPNAANYAPTGVIRVSGAGSKLTADQIITGFRTDGTKYATGNGGKAAVIVENGATMKLNDVYLGKLYNSAGGNERGPVITMLVQSGGTLNCGVVYCREYAYSGRNITINNGTMKATRIEPEWDSENKYKAVNMAINVVSNGVLETTGHFYTANYSSGCSENILFDGGTFRAAANLHTLSTSYFTDATTFTVGPLGMTIDTQGYTIDWNTEIDGGSGKIAKTGSGTLNWSMSSFATGGMDVNAGTLSVSGSGTRFKGPLTVKSGAKFTVKATNQIALNGGLALEAGSTLNIDSPTAGVAPMAVASLSLPDSGTVTLTKNGGAFSTGVYAICSASGVTVEDGAKFAPSTGSRPYSWSVVNGKLVLSVGDVDPMTWTGLGDGISMSDAENWAGFAVPRAGDALYFSSITSATTIKGDVDATFGAVTMGTGVVTFTGDKMKATSFSDTSKIAVGKNATVTLDGDLDFSNTAHVCIVDTVATGGKFVVTGVIRQKADAGDYNLLPCATAGGGAIVAKGLSANKSTYFRLVRDGAGTYNWIVGGDGIVSGNSGIYWLYANENKPHTIIKPLDSDFPIAAKIAVRQNAILTLDTTGDDGNPHTIMLGNGSANYGIYREGVVNIAGTGKVVADYNVSDLISDTGQRVNPFNVTDTATLAIKAGKQITTGAITVNSGATLKVNESGTVKLGGDMTLKNGATLKFNFTERNEAPRLDVRSKRVEFGTKKQIKVT